MVEFLKLTKMSLLMQQSINNKSVQYYGHDNANGSHRSKAEV